MTVSWRQVLALTVVATISVVPTVSAADKCTVPVSLTSADPYVSCNAAVGGAFDFKSPAQSRVSQELFCASSSCLALWGQIKALDQLSCFKYYNTDHYKLWQQQDADDCFANKGERKGSETSLATSPTPTTVTATPTAVPQTTSSAAGVATALGPGTVTPPNYLVEEASKDTSSMNETSASALRSSTRSDTNSSAEAINGAASTSNHQISSATASGSKNAAAGEDHSAEDRAVNVWVYSGASGAATIVVYLFVYMRRRTRKPLEVKNHRNARNPDRPNYIPTQSSSYSYTTNGTITSSVPSSRFAFWEDEAINAVRLPFEKLSKEALVSRGGFGEVYRGAYREKPVAIKILLPERRKSMRQIQKFLAEIKLMAMLEHQQIVRFIGVAWDSLYELCAVTEYMEGGDLRSLLARYSAQEETFPKGFNFDKIKIALHISHALTYMHSLQPMVLHRDLKSRNILLDRSLNAKLTDFGVSRERADTTMTAGVGSSLWMAPEVMMGGRYGEKADVFSFGVVLSELDTQSLPYSHAIEPGRNRRQPDAVVVQMMTAGQLCVKFSGVDETAMAKLGRQCVALNPEDRPSAAEVQHRIHCIWRSFVVFL